MKYYSMQEVNRQFKQKPQKRLWTAVIPAAGRGTRLGYDKPKILYPVAGRPILDWLIDILEPTCERLIFILSPHGAPVVEPFLAARLAGRYEIAFQEQPPQGMADAIYQAVPKLSSPYTLIIWGDQVAIHPKTIQCIMKIQQYSDAKLTMPMVKRPEPYVHYETDSNGRFVRVLERREGAAMPEIGESDCGLFVFDTARLREIFELEINRGITYSQATKEWNFLPMLPQFESGAESVKALRLDSIEETIGVNNRDEAAILEHYLRSRM